MDLHLTPPCVTEDIGQVLGQWKWKKGKQKHTHNVTHGNIMRNSTKKGFK